MNNDLIAELLQQHNVDSTNLTMFCDTAAGPLYTVPLEGASAIDVWHTMRKLTEVTGAWPVISASRAALGYSSADTNKLIAYLQGDAIGRVIAAGESIDPIGWLDARLNRDAAIVAEEGDNLEAYWAELEGSWPEVSTPRSSFTVANEEVVELHLVPTTVPWHVPAFYRYGGTSTPLPEEHVALTKYWNKLHEAEMVSYGGDLIELSVQRPPETQDAAKALAWRHYAYCPDAVIQGSGTIAALAATLLAGTAWYFWWD